MIGDKLRERRLELQLTQLQVAELSNIKKNTISNYENNISSPSEENLLILMKVLKCDANYLFSDFVNSKSFSPKEQEHIEKYRILDEHGKKVVDFILNEEYSRCASEIKTAEIRIAAVNGTTATMTDDAEKIHKDVQDLINKRKLPK